MGRIRWIDAVKGVAILLVMLAHFSEQVHPVLTWLVLGYVPIFFVMSGLTYHSTDNEKESIRKRAKQLWIPYLCYGLSILVITALLSKNVSFFHGFLGLLYGRYCLFPLGSEMQFELLKACYYIAPLWFLPCMWLVYLLMMLQDHLHNKWILPLFALLLSMLSQYKPILLPYSLDTCFAAYLFMECGRQLSKIKNLPIHWAISLLMLILCSVVYYIIGSINGSTNMSVGLFGQIAPWSICCFLLLGITESISFSILFRWLESSFLCRIFSYLGRKALRLMCIHLLVGSLFYKVLCHTSMPECFCLAFAIAGVVGVCAFIDILIDRVSRFGGRGLISNL